MIDLAAVAPSLHREPSGIWTSGGDIPEGTFEFLERGHADLLRIEDGSFWFAHRNDIISNALRRYPMTGTFLDIGGGNGIVSKRLEKDGIDTVLLEPGTDGAAHAHRRGLRNVVRSTLEDAHFAASTFGGAGLFDVIEHVEDDVALLEATRRVLRPNGVLAVTVPAYQWLWSAEDEAAGHHRRYTRRALNVVLRRAGFEPRWSSYFFSVLTVPLFVGRSLRHRLGSRELRSVELGAANQHVTSRGTRLAIDGVLAPERALVRLGHTVPVGTSCIAIATAPG